MKVEELITFDEKYIFNNYGNSYDKSFSFHVNGISDNERGLYEKNIRLLEEKIIYLTNQINKA